MGVMSGLAVCLTVFLAGDFLIGGFFGGVLALSAVFLPSSLNTILVNLVGRGVMETFCLVPMELE